MGKYDHSVTFFSFARQRVTDHYLENSEEIEAPGHRTRGSRWSKRGLFCRFATGNSSIWLHWNPIAAQGTYYPTRGLSLRSVDSLAGAQWCGEQAPGQARGLSSRALQSQLLRCMQDLRAPTGKQTHVPCPARRGANSRTTRGVPWYSFFKKKPKKKKKELVKTLTQCTEANGLYSQWWQFGAWSRKVWIQRENNGNKYLQKVRNWARLYKRGLGWGNQNH